MARRKDHSPAALKQLVVQAARQIIIAKGATALTVRALAARIGYAPGTLYNLFPDMEAVAYAVHHETLGGLHASLRAVVGATRGDFSRIEALALDYCRYAAENRALWLAVFATPRTGALPRWYRQRLQELFGLIEQNLRLCLGMGAAESRRMARLLWACLHGITMLTLDGRLRQVGASEATILVQTLLAPYRPVAPKVKRG